MKPLTTALAVLAAAALPTLVPAQEGAKGTDKLLQRFVDEFVALTPGEGKFPASFMMGSGKDGPPEEQPTHKVSLGYPFALGKYEVTQELYAAIVGSNPSRWKGPRNSVEMIDWDEARTFCGKITQELRKRKLLGEDEVIRLPSEAEWEYACRAGTTTKFSFGDDAGDLGDFAWFTGNAKGNDPPVGVKKPNPWGLYDVHGYVWEWCLDAWRDSYENAPADGSPVVTDKAKKRAIRGGAWTEPADHCRSAFRVGAPVETRSPAIGLRCVRSKKNYD
jgi:formylglycine-generating enzyme required for sulfatase activity